MLLIDRWDNELDNMNNGKEGASYRYPNSFVQLLGYMRVYFHLPYRQTEGVVREYILVVKYALFQITQYNKQQKTKQTRY